MSSGQSDRPYASFGRGPFGRWAIVTGRKGGALRVEVYLNKRDRARNKGVFDRMAAEQARWDAAAGEPLSWERLPERDASRIAARYAGTLNLDDEASRAFARDWTGEVLEKMYKAMDAQLRAEGEAVKAGLASAGDEEPDEDDLDDDDGPLG